ncbi:hypothetical protein EVAR_773_1 [Eumeta japonica]|uniref:Uncharacterized protein n=1 Tax=Eumeta variegata TaxID=151549 RepID=A0A4C1SBX0_EUMVA|nr:hypothetical protein EVAR_773_1 [Eumeta japonica]
MRVDVLHHTPQRHQLDARPACGAIGAIIVSDILFLCTGRGRPIDIVNRRPSRASPVACAPPARVSAYVRSSYYAIITSRSAGTRN